MKKTETQLVKACLDWMHLHGVVAWRSNTGAFAGEYKGRKRFVRFGVKGVADIIGCLHGGRFIAVECKMRPNRQTPQQHAFAFQVEAVGGLYVLAYSLDDLIAAMETKT